MSQKKVRAAYETKLATWAAARTPALRVQHENVPFNPAHGETYLRAYLLPATTTSPDLAGDITTYQGVFQISVVAPINSGPGIANGIAEELEAQFPVNQLVSVSAFVVQQVTPASVAPALQTESEYIVPVSFQYRADT